MSDRRQRQKEQRAAKREAEKKQDARRELARRLGTAAVFGLVVVGIFAFSGIFGGESTDLPGSYEGFRAQETACGGDLPSEEQVMSFPAPETQDDITSNSTVTATLETSCGEIVMELETANRETTNSFVFLAREGYFDGQVFHRVVKDFLVQGGDPEANGTGGPGYIIADEYPSDDFTYERGVVAMGNRGAKSTGSQFFIVTGEDARHLLPQFNILGNVVSGLEVLDEISAVPTSVAPGSVEESLPLETVYIEKVTIEVSGS
jgi:cyclophilin family peptidyl-prolyl cis-trans isomerase